MQVSKPVQKYIESHTDLIQDHDFLKLYELAATECVGHVGELTELLLNIGINPLDYMNIIPTFYADNATTITELKIPENIQSISEGGLAYSPIKNIEIHDNCELSPSSFIRSSIESIKIPYIMNEVPPYCFHMCTNLRFVDLNAVERIEDSAFIYCTELENIIVPDKINFISDSAFLRCPRVRFNIHEYNDYAMSYARRHNIKVKIL